MRIHKEIFIESLPYKPYAYEFIGNDFILFHSGASSVVYIYSINGEFQKLIKQHSNGKRNLFRAVNEKYFSFGNVIYDREFEPTNKNFKALKKSVEKYFPTYGPNYNQRADSIIVGFVKGIIGFYNHELIPMQFKELGKDEVLIHISEDDKLAYSHNESKGLVIQYSFPEFIKTEEFKIPKQNTKFIFTNEHLFNYGYTSTNVQINLSSKKTKNIQFHPTRKSRYKDQYEGSHNFGTSWVKLNTTNNNEILVCTVKSKALVYSLETERIIQLKAHEILNFDPYKRHNDKHMHRGFFKGNHIYTNFGSKFILWNAKGEAEIIQKKVDNINIDSNHQAYSLTDDNLYKIYIE